MGKAVVQTPVALGMLFALALCWSLQGLWRASFGPFLEWLANLGISFNALVTHVNVHPFRFAHTINRNVQSVLTQGIAMAEKNFVRALNAIVEPFLLMAGVTVALGLVGYEGLSALWHYVKAQVPRVIHQTIVRPVERAQKTTAAVTRAQFNALRHRMAALSAHVAHIAATIPHAIPQVIPRLGHLERSAVDYVKLHKWLKRSLLGALGASIVLAALRRLGLAWTRCTNVKKMGRGVCAAHPEWMKEFLAGLVVIVGATSFREFVEEAQAGEKLALDLLSPFIREIKGLELDRAKAAALGFATLNEEQ